MDEKTWHTLSSEECLTRLNSSPQGLSTQQALQALVQHGANELPHSGGRKLSQILLGQFTDVMILVLLAAAIISGFIGEPQDTIAIIVIIFINAVIGTVQEFRAEKAVAALKKMSAPDAQAMRDAKLVTVAARELVPGDLVILEAGSIVPADLRLIETEEIEIDESALTGESLPVKKHTQVIEQADTALAERSNQAFKSSLVTKGKGMGVVVATGSDTQIGHIAKLLSSEEQVKTPLQKRLIKFGRYLALVILAICALVFIAGVLQGQPPLLMLLTAISLAVAAIPEALPAVTTVSLAFGAHKLIQQNALVRNLPSVETLGSVTYICSDKTGTLTQNKMTVERFVGLGEVFENIYNPQQQPWNHLFTALALNNDVALRDSQTTGEPTELALYEAAEKHGFQKSLLEKTLPRTRAIPFDSNRKMMTTLHRNQAGTIAYVKGAPESVLVACNSQLSEHSEQPFDAGEALKQAESLANNGYRVIAVAQRQFETMPTDLDSQGIENDLTFIGMVALIDPPRPEAQQAVADCISAGMTPVMITGDHPGTAQFIAHRLGINGSKKEVITGQALSKLNDNDYLELVKTIRVYARVSPEQKLRIVKALQANGEFVAMTGDGVNDAPALKRAGIGVSMGNKGTDVAREASDMVLLDDNFATIVGAVHHGRRIFDNIRKFISYTMSSNAGEIWTLFLAPFLGLPIPLLPIHILWINLVTDGLPGLAFTAEPAEPGIMKRPPRAPNENIFAHGMWQHIVWVGLFIGGLCIAAQAWAIANNIDYWQTIVFTVLTLSQLFHAMAIRSEKESLFTIGILSNKPMIGALIFTVALQMAVIYLPVFNGIFYTQPLPLIDLFWCFALSSTMLVAVEIEKWLVRKGLIYTAN